MFIICRYRSFGLHLNFKKHHHPGRPSAAFPSQLTTSAGVARPGATAPGSAPVATIRDMEDITELFDSLLRQYGSADIAEAEFKKMIHEEPELRAAYREWCDEVGSSERKGFHDYCEEYFASQDSIWDNLKEDFDE